MNTRIYNARILTLADDSFDIFNGEVQVKGNRIAYVGPEKETEEKWDREINAEGNLVMPGFKNAHTHSAMTFLRSYADDMPLFDWLNEQIFPKEAQLTGDDIFWGSKLAIMEYLTSGVTANLDMYFQPEMIAKASVDCGFRTVLQSSLNDFVSSLEEMEDEYNKFNNYNPLISYKLGFHAEYTTSEERLKGVAALAEKYKAPVYTHNSETAREVKECVERHGKTPTAYLDSLGIFNYGGGSYHSVYMTDEDMKICREKNISVVSNPGSNTKLASGIAPLQEMLGRGINIALGTDGPASNNCLDMFREMFLATGLGKLREEDASAVPAEQVVKMAAKNGAIAMGLTECDSLQEGKLADIIMIDLHQPNMQPLNNIVKNLVYSGSKQNVKMTMVDGKILYEDNKFNIGVDPETVYEKVNAVINRMKLHDKIEDAVEKALSER